MVSEGTNETLKPNLTKTTEINQILESFRAKNPTLQTTSERELRSVTDKALTEIDSLETMSRKRPSVPETAEEARKIKAIWVLSGPGTYDREFKDDRYKDKPWAAWMDKKRLNYAGMLVRELTEKITGRSFHTPLGKKLTMEEVEQIRTDIENHGPFIIYNGREDENETVESVLERDRIIIPKSKVHIIGAGIENSVSQVKSFNLPESLQLQAGDVIGVVTHAPHMMRIMHMANKYRPFPTEATIQAFPLHSPTGSMPEYANQEVEALLYYTFVTGDSTEQSYSYKL